MVQEVDDDVDAAAEDVSISFAARPVRQGMERLPRDGGVA